MKKLIIAIIVIIVSAVGYYLISPIFINVEVDEALPDNIINEEPVEEAERPAEVLSGTEKLSLELKNELDRTVEDMNTVEVETMDEAMPKTMEEATNLPEEMEDIVVGTKYPIKGTVGHRASGYVRVLETTTGKVIRYEDFDSINGPDLHIYLTNDLEATDYYDLGKVKGTQGNINYPVPSEVDPSDYKYVIYWCEPFKVLFSYAEIN